ncbi:MAG: NAD(P)-dependent oxidoreductase [Hahellaceae bacterium]|nr:NAD(P)-dependent oxidoreductase [Hahellaceae bacterium]
MKIAFIGVGLMGRPMVENLLAAGHSLILWNRTATKAQSFAARAVIAANVAEAIAQADVVITMLENGPIVRAVVFNEDSLAAFRPGTLFIDMSSIPPAMAREHAQWLDARGCYALDAPVSGGTIGAAQATLSIMVGGAQEAYARAQSLFSALGTARYMGEAGTGQVAKLANQAIVGITIGAVSEALLLAEKAGADPRAVREALLGGFAASRILELHGQRMIDRQFSPGARATVQLKDMGMIVGEAEQVGLNMPLAELTKTLYHDMVEGGFGDLDHSGLFVWLEKRSQA